MDFTNIISELQNFAMQYLNLLTVLLCLGFGVFVKKCTSIKNDYIIPMNLLLGVLVAVWVNGFAFTPEIVAQGIVSGAAATAFYEMYKNKKQNFGEG